MTINFNKKKILVIGLGDTGQSVLHFLMSKECVIHAIDTRPNLENLDEIKARFKGIKFSVGEAFNDEVINDIELIIISPGVSLKESYVQSALNQGHTCNW